MSSTLYSPGEMPTTLPDVSDAAASKSDVEAIPAVATYDWLLRHRLKSVEVTWATVLEDECGADLVALLTRLRQLCAPDGQANAADASPVLRLIEELELSDAIKMARAFALYFQLINIVEQHYEQRGQQQQYRAAYEDAAILNRKDLADRDAANRDLAAANKLDGHRSPTVDQLASNGTSRSGTNSDLDSRRDVGTFYWLFPTLKRLNVPPKMIQRLLDQLDVRLVFTAHPTEIVRHTIRDKQRRISTILRQLDREEDGARAIGLVSSWEIKALQSQLIEEIRLWWRTDELHQFKPSVLDEVDFTLHYFDVVLFDTIPQLYQRICRALEGTFPSTEAAEPKLLSVWVLGRQRSRWQPLSHSTGHLEDSQLPAQHGDWQIYWLNWQAHPSAEPVSALERSSPRSARITRARSNPNAGDLRRTGHSLPAGTLPAEAGLY